jgi:Ca2+-binding RTX toxin-like protein
LYLVDGGGGNDYILVLEDAGKGIVFGGEGADNIAMIAPGATAYGGLGNDRYMVSAEDIKIIELDGEGIDEIEAQLTSFDLAVLTNIENLTGLYGGQKLSGNSLNNTISTNGKGNTLSGRSGNDTLIIKWESWDNSNPIGPANKLLGGEGNDTLQGNKTIDILYGGKGIDTMTGGAGNDTFDFNTISDSGLTLAERDQITDFRRGEDRIDLSTIDANTALKGNNSFKFIGSDWFSKKGGEVRVWHNDVAGTHQPVRHHQAYGWRFHSVVASQ